MILKCGLSPPGVRPAVCIDECQVLLRIKHYSSVISPAQKVQVLDAVFGWTGFQPSYAKSTWQWLTAAFDPKYAYIAFTLISAVPLRLLLSSASLSEESLVRVCGESQCNIPGPNFLYCCTLLLMQTPPVSDNSHSSHTRYPKKECEGVFQAPTEEQYLSTDSPRGRLFN